MSSRVAVPAQVRPGVRLPKERQLRLHRVMGRVYLIAILCGAIGALGLSITAPTGGRGALDCRA